MRYIEILEYLGLEGIVEGFPYFTIVTAILLAFVITIVGMPKAIKHLRNLGEVTPDKYRRGEASIPTKGGIATLMASLFTLCFIALFSDFSLINFVIMCIILAYAFFGILDDYIHIKNRWWNIAVPFFFAFPLIFIIDLDIAQYPFFGQIAPGPIFFIAVVPLYVLVVSNLVNMHSGFNGLQSGLSSIIFIFLFIKIFLSNNLDYMIAPACIAGSNFGFWFFNRYPARILEGNIGSLVNGATIGIMIVISGFLLAGFVMLIPHTINFLMYFYWRVQRLRKSKYGYGNMNPYYGSHKFGRLRNDGTIEVPNRLTLKWFLPFHFRMTEVQATRAMYAITTGFCIIGLFIPY